MATSRDHTCSMYLSVAALCLARSALAQTPVSCTAPLRGGTGNGFDQECRVRNAVCLGGACVPEASGIRCTDSTDCCGNPLSCNYYCDMYKTIADFPQCRSKIDNGGICTMNEDCKSGYCDKNNTPNGFFETCQQPNAARVSPSGMWTKTTTSTSASSTSAAIPSSVASRALTSTITISQPTPVAPSTSSPQQQQPTSASTPNNPQTDSDPSTRTQSDSSTSSPPFTSTAGFKALISIIILALLALLLFLFLRRRNRQKSSQNLVQNVSSPSPANPIYQQYIAVPPTPEIPPRSPPKVAKVAKGGPEMVAVSHHYEDEKERERGLDYGGGGGRESLDEGDLSLGAKALIVDEPLEGGAVVDVGDRVPRVHGDARVVDWSGRAGGVEVVIGTARFIPRESTELFLTPNTEIQWLATYADGWGYGTNVATEQSGFFPMALVKGEAAERAAKSGNLNAWG
ncbi:hypothetical protein HK097_009362 [Rhizophlyctis rosea]|uniref:SH3 domain-containing protein n=1 Tax=Rhizophlyctis rosea TaxID=64517 RepID=A0AAD5S921_9FUNG|nr:hypothetical protein HK097_009362 [Rhizophlyctis rosea]